MKKGIIISLVAIIIVAIIVSVIVLGGQSEENQMSNQNQSTVVENITNQINLGDYVDYNATIDNNGNSISKAYVSEKNGKVNQTFRLETYSGGWKFLGTENGRIKLISADIIFPDVIDDEALSSVKKQYILTGKDGYINGIEELDNISDMYGYGKYAQEARSVVIEDINQISKYVPENKTINSNDLENQFGKRIKYSWNSGKISYNISDGSNGTINFYNTTSMPFYYFDDTSRTFNILEENKTIEITSDFYQYYPSDIGISSNSIEWDLIFPSKQYDGYWMASSFRGFDENGINYGIRAVGGIDAVIGGDALYHSIDRQSSGALKGVRVVVYLLPGTQIDYSNTSADGSSIEKAWKLKF